MYKAEYWLECYHVIGRNRKYYVMPCNILKKMGDDKLKIEVFGNMFWGGEGKKIRYVKKNRLIKKKIEGKNE